MTNTARPDITRIAIIAKGKLFAEYAGALTDEDLLTLQIAVMRPDGSATVGLPALDTSDTEHAPDLAMDADAEPIVIGPGCVARGDVISYRGESYRRARAGELVLDPAQGRMFRAFLDTLETTPTACTPDEPCGITHPVYAVACVLTAGHDGDHDHTDDDGKGVSWSNVPDPAHHRKQNGPWPTAADVPDNVRFTAQSIPLRHSIFKRTHRTDEYAALNDYTTTRGFRIWDEDAVDELAPFVRTDGDQA